MSVKMPSPTLVKFVVTFGCSEDYAAPGRVRVLMTDFQSHAFAGDPGEIVANDISRTGKLAHLKRRAVLGGDAKESSRSTAGVRLSH